MPRKPRIHFPGAIYHVRARGVERRPIFVDDDDRRRFLSLLRRYAKELGAKILAYCLMGNHFHLAIQVAESTLGTFMQRLNGDYAGSFNHRHDRVGHLFESRYHDTLCLNDRYLLTLIHYIHMNPVRAGMVLHPGDWPWSSFKPTDGPYPDLIGFDAWNSNEPQLDLKRPPKNVQSIGQAGEGSVRISAIPATRFGRLPATVSVVTPPVWRSDAELLGC